MDSKVATLRASADLTRTWLCVDMDAFFAACEELDNPALVRDLGLRLRDRCCSSTRQAHPWPLPAATTDPSSYKPMHLQPHDRRREVPRKRSLRCASPSGCAMLPRRRASRWRWGASACAARPTTRRASTACGPPCPASSRASCAPVRTAATQAWCAAAA